MNRRLLQVLATIIAVIVAFHLIGMALAYMRVALHFFWFPLMMIALAASLLVLVMNQRK
jgi:hypothetical protein